MGSSTERTEEVIWGEIFYFKRRMMYDAQLFRWAAVQFWTRSNYAVWTFTAELSPNLTVQKQIIFLMELLHRRHCAIFGKEYTSIFWVDLLIHDFLILVGGFTLCNSGSTFSTKRFTRLVRKEMSAILISTFGLILAPSKPVISRFSRFHPNWTVSGTGIGFTPSQ